MTNEARLAADKKWRQKMKETGFKWKSVFIPSDKEAEFLALVDKWKIEQEQKIAQASN